MAGPHFPGCLFGSIPQEVISKILLLAQAHCLFLLSKQFMVSSSSSLKPVRQRVCCPRCSKTVYPLEAKKVSFDKRLHFSRPNHFFKIGEASYHAACIRCLECNGKVSITNAAVFEGSVYCKPHYLRMFQKRGTYSCFDKSKDSSHLPAFGARRQLKTKNSN